MDLVKTIETTRAPSSRLLKHEAGRIKSLVSSISSTTSSTPSPVPYLVDEEALNLWRSKYIDAKGQINDLKT
jgi:hypothetical protein